MAEETSLLTPSNT